VSIIAVKTSAHNRTVYFIPEVVTGFAFDVPKMVSCKYHFIHVETFRTGMAVIFLAFANINMPIHHYEAGIII
jgi:hypothetical protein